MTPEQSKTLWTLIGNHSAVVLMLDAKAILAAERDLHAFINSLTMTPDEQEQMEMGLAGLESEGEVLNAISTRDERNSRDLMISAVRKMLGRKER